jgi:hypothetical protein
MAQYLMNDELESIWKEAAAVSFTVLSKHSLEGLRKTTKSISRCPGQLRLQARSVTASANFIDRPAMQVFFIYY